MKCLFTDILSTSTPETSFTDPAFQLIAGSRQELNQLEQGRVLVQHWYLATIEVLLIQSFLHQPTSFEIRHSIPMNFCFLGIAGVSEISVYRQAPFTLESTRGYFFNDAAIQGFVTLRSSKELSSLLIVSLPPSGDSVSAAFTISPILRLAIERVLFTSYQNVQAFHVFQIQELVRLSQMAASSSLPTIHFGEKDIEGIQMVKALIDEAPEKPFTLFQLSQKAGMNMRKLNLGFKNLFQQTIFAYLHERQLQAAHDKILHTHQSLKVIGRGAGYKSYANFSSAFKAFFGYPPSHLRKK